MKDIDQLIKNNKILIKNSRKILGRLNLLKDLSSGISIQEIITFEESIMNDLQENRILLEQIKNTKLTQYLKEFLDNPELNEKQVDILV